MDWGAVTALGTVAAAVGVLYGFYQTSKTLKDQRVSNYVERFQGILSNLPYNIFAEGNSCREDTPEIRKWLVLYIDLCAEELFDRQRGAIGHSPWSDWSISIREDFTRSPLLSSVFGEVKSDYRCLEKFLESKEGRVPSLKECQKA